MLSEKRCGVDLELDPSGRRAVNVTVSRWGEVGPLDLRSE